MKVRPKDCSRKKYVSGKSSAFVDEDGNESKIKSRRVYFVQTGDAGRVNGTFRAFVLDIWREHVCKLK